MRRKYVFVKDSSHPCGAVVTLSEVLAAQEMLLMFLIQCFDLKLRLVVYIASNLTFKQIPMRCQQVCLLTWHTLVWNYRVIN